MSEQKYDYGMIGLGTMGRNLVFNMADHGFSVSGFDQDLNQVDNLEKEKGDAISWTHFKKVAILDPKYNNAYIKDWVHPETEIHINILKSININDHTNNSDKMLHNIICKTMANIPEDKRPLYCYNKEALKFYYVNDDNKWVKTDDSIFEKLYVAAYFSMFKAKMNTIQGVLNSSTLYKDYNLFNRLALKDGNNKSFEDLQMTIDSGAEVQDNFIQKLKIALAKICKKDGDGYTVDNKSSKEFDTGSWGL